jgi:GPH family glycoside/pentoside/hexuronide:cation symporter
MKLNLKQKLLYSSGSLGMGIVTVMHMLFLVWFFQPSDSANLPNYIPQDPVLLALSVLGLLLALRTLFDAVSDPIIANFSDKFKHKDGKRIPLLKWSAIPFAASYFLVFLVPNTGITTLNVVWITVWLVICTFFLTVYSINHEALLAVMAKTSKERIDLGTIASASWFVGFIVVSFASSVWGPLQNMFGMPKEDAIRIVFFVLAVIGACLLIVPGLFIKEKDYDDGKTKTIPHKINVYKSLSKVMHYKNYRKFVFANTLYTAATNIFETGLIFFVTILAVLEEDLLGVITIVIGGITLLMYPLINILAKKKGRKFVLVLSFITYAITFGVISIMSPNPSPWLYLGIILVVAPFSQAGFGILPVIIASDNAEYMKNETGEDMTGMHMGVSGFFRKLGSTISAVLFTSFLLLGQDIGNDIGIRLAVIVAAVLSILGFVIMVKYDENEVMKHREGLE